MQMDLAQLLAAQQAGSLDLSNFPRPDTAETIVVSSLALIKMLRHGRAGVPMEVMGLMLGEFIDDYTIKVADVFAMPQSGTTVNVEAVDPVFQHEMLELLQQTQRPENVVGWYHSHPGFGPWLSNVDCNTQESFEKLHPRAVAVVIDPIQSVRGKVVIDAFRLIPKPFMLTKAEPREATSHIGALHKPTARQVSRGLERAYYHMPIRYRMSSLEQRMLLNVNQKPWMEGLTVRPVQKHSSRLRKSFDRIVRLASDYDEIIRKEAKMTKEDLELDRVGKVDARRHIRESSKKLLGENIDQMLGGMLSNVMF